MDPPLLGHEKSFSRIAASQRPGLLDCSLRVACRLIYLDSIENDVKAKERSSQHFSIWILRRGLRPSLSPRRRFYGSAPTAFFFKFRVRKFARGDFVNILMGVEDAPEAFGVDFIDFSHDFSLIFSLMKDVWTGEPSRLAI